MKEFFKKAALAILGAVLALGVSATPALAATSQYAKTLELTSLTDGETVQVYKLMSYSSDYNTYEFDNTAEDGKTSFKSYLDSARGEKSAEDYLASLKGDDLSTFLGTYLYGSTYAKPEPAAQKVSGSSTNLTLEPGYYLISIETTTEACKIYTPFSAFVKMDGESSTILAGSMTAASSESKVTVEMKHTDGPTIEKKVRRDNGTDADTTWKTTKTVTVGDEVTYRIKLNVPNWQAGTTPFLQLQDTLTNQEYVNASVAIYTSAGDQGSDYNPTGEVQSGAIAEDVIGQYTNGLQNVSFKLDYSKLTGGETYYITYKAKVMSDITGTANTGDTKATNSAVLEYSTSNSSHSKTTPSTTTLYTYSAKLTKQDMDNKLLPGSGFTVYSDESCTQPIKFEKVSTGVNSWYYRADENGDVTEIQADGEGAYLLIKGLDPYKDYYFKETTTPKGYYAPSNAFKLDLDSQMTVDDNTEHSGTLSNASAVTALDQTADGKLVSGNVDNDYSNQFDIVIKNSSTPSLPTTGGMGTVLFTVAGVVLMAAAAGAYVVLRRRRQ